MDTLFTESFESYPEGCDLGVVPGNGSYPPDAWSTHLYAHSHVSQSNLVWVPQSWHWGGTWYTPRRSYQNDTRFMMSATNVIEMQMSCNNYSNGILKMGFVPEYYPGEMWTYNGAALYVEIQFTDATHLKAEFYRQYGVGESRTNLATSSNNAYVPNQKFTFQIGTTAGSLYYGTNCLINQMNHQTNGVAVYPVGAYPHYEYQNESGTSNAVMSLDDIRVRPLSGFESP